MLQQIIAYIKFLKRSTNQHGVHSPFVYNLITKCFYDKSKYNKYKEIASYRKALRKSKDTINVIDLGSGSRVFKTSQRSVSKMVQKVGASKKESKLLFRLVNYLQINTILELGTSLGIATHAMAVANPEIKMTSIEGCPNISAYTKGTLGQFNLKNTEILTGDFNDAIKPLALNKYDLIYFDGNHQKQATLDYFETLLTTTTNDSFFIFDDIYWSKEMTEAWEIIKKHPQVTVTIDTFFLGFVFFRKEQKKEHFKIRI
ncbi:O-methyltransferase [Lacinutrix sp. Bg11-31]|uniref:O-methyltransferase n=1 Tax=Lacinutrix sp. Bg11-31 TaxID=2057808 RepID=UPI000C312677|nr:class I SAM-dependent methyltransferase [Lacinutrix sp. Bg11-31]AUC82091.1 methyltransferase [Lacinutrix sp. Bg11-31]